MAQMTQKIVRFAVDLITGHDRIMLVEKSYVFGVSPVPTWITQYFQMIK